MLPAGVEHLLRFVPALRVGALDLCELVDHHRLDRVDLREEGLGRLSLGRAVKMRHKLQPRAVPAVHKVSGRGRLRARRVGQRRLSARCDERRHATVERTVGSASRPAAAAACAAQRAVARAGERRVPLVLQMLLRLLCVLLLSVLLLMREHPRMAAHHRHEEAAHPHRALLRKVAGRREGRRRCVELLVSVSAGPANGLVRRRRRLRGGGAPQLRLRPLLGLVRRLRAPHAGGGSPKALSL